MVQVVDYEEFKSVEHRLKKAEELIDFLMGQLLYQQWLTRAQAMRALNVSESTLHRLTKAKRIAHRYEGRRPLYSVTGIRNYLSGQHIEAAIVNQRLVSVGLAQ